MPEQVKHICFLVQHHFLIILGNILRLNLKTVWSVVQYTVFHYMPNNRLDIGLEPIVHVTAMLPIPQEFYQQHILLFGANIYVAVHF